MSDYNQYIRPDENQILNYLSKNPNSSFKDLLKIDKDLNEDFIRWALEDLKNKGLISFDYKKIESYHLTDEGKGYIEGLPEEKFLKYIEKNKVSVSEAGKINMIGFIWAKKNGWIEIKDNIIIPTDNGERELSSNFKNYETRVILQKINEGSPLDSKIDNSLLKNLISRKLVLTKESSVIVNINLLDLGKEVANLKLNNNQSVSIDSTGNILYPISIIDSKDKGGFKEVAKIIQPYNIKAEVPIHYPAMRHPMNEFINFIKLKMVSLGFTETKGSIIEPSFWVFDTLFSPQDHPTRDMQDTFFLNSPDKIDVLNKDLIKKIKNMHEYNWKGRWSLDKAEEAVLRTHTTAVSAHSMYEYANKKDVNYPIKLFTIGKVFRNESLDYKHLAELYQLDGIIIGKKLNLSNLIMELTEFYKSIGLEIRVQPSYFPFTEPSLEIHYFSKEHDDWIEMGGGGIIRKEITDALGLKGLTVLAWGLGLDRMLLSKVKLNSVIDIYTNNIKWLRSRHQLDLE